MQLTKKIVRVGNSAGVILPKGWQGGVARVELIKKPINIKQDLLEILDPHLSEVVGIYLTGSYARGEETKDSDVDVLVITNNLQKRIKQGKYEIILISKGSLKSVLEKNVFPLLFMLKEAKPLMNSELIEKYKNTELTKKNLKFHIETTKSAMKVIEKSIEVSDEMGILEGDGSAYSLILRLRGIYLINCLKTGKKWSKPEFLKLIKEISGSLNAYYGYLRVKNDLKAEDKLSLAEAKKLCDYILKQIKLQESWINSK